MGKYQTWTVVLRKGSETVELKNDHGHVWRRVDGVGGGSVLYDANKERELMETLLRQHTETGFVVVSDHVSGRPPGWTDVTCVITPFVA